MRTWLCLAAVVPFTVWSATPVLAQDDPAPAERLPPAITLTYTDGRVEIARATGVAAAQVPDLLDEDDRLVTNDGRAELALEDGGLVHVDAGADARVERGGLRLVRGRMTIHTAAGDPLDILTPAGAVRLEPSGLYEITARDLEGDTTVAAVRGRATLRLATADVPIAADDEVAVDPRHPDPRWSRYGNRRDAFTDWASRRVEDMQLAQRGQPLPVELAAYAPALATYGRWDTLPGYGSAWFPTAGPAWRPYANGSWRYTRYGWTWIDSDPWGWPVHHYGRWGRHPSRGWYWLPRRGWGPAWVGWAVEADYVGWAPLGWNARPVVDFFVGARLGPLDLWAGSWSVVPRRFFGGPGPIGRYATDLRYLPGPVLGGFVAQRQPPRGPWGWERRLSPAAGYGRPTPPGRMPGAFDRRPGGRGPAGSAVPRTTPRPRGLDAARPADAAPHDAGHTDPRPWDARDGAPPATDRDRTRRPADARSRRGDGDERTRTVAPPAQTGAPSNGRPAPAAGRAWGGPDGETPRPGAGDRGRGGERRGGGAARGADEGRGGAGGRQPATSSGAVGGGNRRRPR